MTTYICKCGKTFRKNTEAGTTGFRMPGFGPDHECYGCPFIRTEQWREDGKDVDVYACRGSKVLDYQTDAYGCDSKGAELHVRTLDLRFIKTFFEDYLTLPGHTNEKLYHGMDSPENGRQQYSFGFAANKQGDADRKTLVNRYFRSEGERPGALPSGCDRLVRKDVDPEQEKEIVLNQIKEAKAVAQGKKAQAEAGGTAMAYLHGQWRYFVDKREDNGKFTVFMSSSDPTMQGMRTEVATIPDFDTFEQAQNALDGLALKRGFSTERSTGEEKPEVEQQTFGSEPDESGGSVPTADDIPKVEQGNGCAEFRNDGENSENDSPNPDNENPPSNNDSGDSANDSAEQPPQSCDWKNASGNDDDDEESKPNDEPKKVSGEPLDLRGDEFSYIVDPANAALNHFVAMLHAKKQHDGEINIKITFEDDGGSYAFGGAVSGKINLAMKPQKVTGDAVELQFDAQGNPIIPADREHQLSFDEISGGTATVDGNTGIVEDYQEDGKNGTDSDVSENQEEQPDNEEQEEQLFPCKNTNCPFYVYDTDDPDASGCGFSNFKREEIDLFDVAEAAEQNGCTRPEVLQTYADAQSGKDENHESEEE